MRATAANARALNASRWERNARRPHNAASFPRRSAARPINARYALLIQTIAASMTTAAAESALEANAAEDCGLAAHKKVRAA